MNVELSGWLQCKNNVEADGGDGVFGGGGGEPRDFSPRKKKKKRNEPENEMSIEVFDTARSFSWAVWVKDGNDTKG